MLRFSPSLVCDQHMLSTGYSFDDIMGPIPAFLSADDPRGAVEQIDDRYRVIGGGWRDSKGWTIAPDQAFMTYPGDPPRALIATAHLRDETILMFNGAYVAVVQPDGSYRVARID